MPAVKTPGETAACIFSLKVPPRIQTSDNGWIRLNSNQPSTTEHQENDALDDDERQGLITATTRSCCWKLESPYWSVECKQLFSITYAPAWQTMPEHTISTRSTSPCGATCCCPDHSDDDDKYTTDVFGVPDIISVEPMTITVHGDDPLPGLRITCRPLELEGDFQVPTYLQSAWRQHQNRASSNHRSEDVLSGPVVEICLATTTDAPLLSRVTIPPNPDFPIAIRTITLFDGTLQTAASTDRGGDNDQPTHIFINGYQSWSFAGSVPRGDPQPKSRLCDVFSKAFNNGATLPPHMNRKKKKPHYQSDFFTCISSDGTLEQRRCAIPELDETGGPALVLGWLTQRHQFGLITANANLDTLQTHCSLDDQWLLPHRLLQTDWSYTQLLHPHSYDEEPMADYLQAVAASNAARVFDTSLLTGWCSWYVFYENITAARLRDNVARLVASRQQIPTNVVVVDDGYMTAWGDWHVLQPGRFTDMAAVARDVAAQGMRPGVWLAPFAADKKSRLALAHPEWVIRNNAGQPANSSHCGKFFYGLDATHPGVLEHVRRTIRMATEEWGFTVLKIDFLYAACLEGNGKYDPTMSRAEAMHVALQTIREAAGPDVFLIGCGCPIASGIGFIDAMRISADTGPTWRPSFPLPKYDNGTLPSLRAMIRNSISRAPFGHRWWHNDPDCIMLGRHTRLSDEEVASAATVVAMTCGMLLLSDDLPKVSQRRLNIVSKIFPLTGITATVLDLHSTNDGLPSLLRLWCTDKYGLLESFHDSNVAQDEEDHNLEATHFARESAKALDRTLRRRNCVHVAKGLGTWTVVSVSNWTDRTAVVRVPPPALLPPPKEGWGVHDDFECVNSECGYHVFAFWSSQYKWLPKVSHDDDPNPETITRKLRAHESEIFHIKRVTANSPQYIGSDIHFTCGYEVRSFRYGDNQLSIVLRSNYDRQGFIFVYIPRVNVSEVVKVVNGFSIVGTVPVNGKVVGRIIRIPVALHSRTGGNITIHY